MRDTFKTSCHYGGPFVKILFRANPCFFFSLFVNNGKPSKIYLFINKEQLLT